MKNFNNIVDVICVIGLIVIGYFMPEINKNHLEFIYAIAVLLAVILATDVGVRMKD